MDRLHILGNGDSLGVPRVYCDCEVCREARSFGSNRRLRSSVLLAADGEELLIDCGPDWPRQMELAERRHVAQTLITHAHFDHIAGLPQWADCCRWTETKGTLYAPAEVQQTLRIQFPWLERNIDFIPNDDGMVFAGWRIRTWKVCHGKNGFSFAYRFEKDGFVWAYASDCINLTESQKEPLRGLDLLIIGTSFVREPFPMHTRSVYDMHEAAELMKELRPGRTLFTHMSHGVDVREALPLPAGAGLAEAGMTVELV